MMDSIESNQETTLSQDNQKEELHTSLKMPADDDSTTFVRIGEALVQAQTRARESQAHAQRCERLLRTVLSSSEEDLLDNNATLEALRRSVSSASISSSTTSVNNNNNQTSTASTLSFSDWDMLQSIVYENKSSSYSSTTEPLPQEVGSTEPQVLDNADFDITTETITAAVTYPSGEVLSDERAAEKTIDEMAAETLARIQTEEDKYQKQPLSSPDKTPWRKMLTTLKRWLVLRLKKYKSPVQTISQVVKDYARPLEMLMSVMVGVFFGIAYSKHQSGNISQTPSSSSSEHLCHLLAELNRLRSSSSSAWDRICSDNGRPFGCSTLRGQNNSAGWRGNSAHHHHRSTATAFAVASSSSTPAFPVYSRYFESATQVIPEFISRRTSGNSS